ncbi:MAG: hypothetical protein LM589_04880 [Thermosphaera sp.]|nr:hypothetical protein [Thermosphaera sp.]
MSSDITLTMTSSPYRSTNTQSQTGFSGGSDFILLVVLLTSIAISLIVILLDWRMNKKRSTSSRRELYS